MTAIETIDATPTDGTNPWIDVLVDGGRWTDGVGKPVTLSYSLKSGIDPNSDGQGNSYNGLSVGKVWSTTEAAALKAAMQTWSAVTNVSFVKTLNNGAADLWYWLGRDAEMPDGALGWHELPAEGLVVPAYGAFNHEDFAWRGTALKPGGDAFLVILHELGHGLGLAHPHEQGNEFPGVTDAFSSYGDYNLNQGIFTTMSYNDGYETKFPNHLDITYGKQMTPMALDIAAVQAIYGKNMGYHKGTDTYVLPGQNITGTGWACIWDAGGYDRISAGLTTRSAYIDLRPAPLVGSHAGGYVSSLGGIIGGFTIANDVVIESASGSQGNDRIYGNNLNNSLYGKTGNDTLNGFYGNDWLDGGLGNDNLNGSQGNDTVSFLTVTGNITVDLRKTSQQYTGAGLDILNGFENVAVGAGNDRLTGNGAANRFDSGAGDDRISGQEGDDVVLAGAGNDYYNGGLGIDTLDFSAAKSAVRANLSLTVRQNTAAAGYDEFHSIENIVGSAFSDTLIGHSSANLLRGGNGNDRLYGGSGSDALQGGNDKDILNGGSGADKLWGGAGDDWFVIDNIGDAASEQANQGIDLITSYVSVSGRFSDDTLAAFAGGSFENFTLLGGSSVNVTGNNDANAIIGNGSGNILNGSGGNDSLTGGLGADTFAFDTGLSASNVDTVTDFVAGEDKISLDSTIFAGLDALTGFLSTQFVIGASASDTEDRIIFDDLTGTLYFDADGSGDLFAAQHFANLSGGVNLTDIDFIVV